MWIIASSSTLDLKFFHTKSGAVPCRARCRAVPCRAGSGVKEFLDCAKTGFRRSEFDGNVDKWTQCHLISSNLVSRKLGALWLVAATAN